LINVYFIKRKRIKGNKQKQNKYEDKSKKRGHYKIIYKGSKVLKTSYPPYKENFNFKNLIIRNLLV
jgi:hypothetical protein